MPTIDSGREKLSAQQVEKKTVNRRTFLRIMAGTTAALVGAASGLLPGSERAVAAPQTQEDEAAAELRQRRKERLDAWSNALSSVAVTALHFLRDEQGFQIAYPDWVVADHLNEHNINHSMIEAHANLLRAAEDPEFLGKYANPEYLPFLLGEVEGTAPATPNLDPRIIYMTQDAQPYSFEWEELTFDTLRILTASQRIRVRNVKINGEYAAYDIYGEVHMNFSAPPNLEDLKRLFHEISHALFSQPNFIFNDNVWTYNQDSISLAGHSYQRGAERYSNWMILLINNFEFFNQRFFLQEGDLTKGFVEQEDGGLLRGIQEWQAMLVADTLGEDISVFDAYPPGVQEELLRTFSGMLYVENPPRAFTRDDLLILKQRIAEVSQGLVAAPVLTENPTPSTGEEIEQEEPGITKGIGDTIKAPNEQNSGVFEGMRGKKTNLTNGLTKRIGDIFKKKEK